MESQQILAPDKGLEMEMEEISFNTVPRRSRDAGSATMEPPTLPLPSRVRRLLSPVQSERLSARARRVVDRDLSTPEAVQREIDRVQRQIDKLSAKKLPMISGGLCVSSVSTSGSEGSHFSETRVPRRKISRSGRNVRLGEKSVSQSGQPPSVSHPKVTVESVRQVSDFRSATQQPVGGLTNPVQVTHGEPVNWSANADSCRASEPVAAKPEWAWQSDADRLHQSSGRVVVTDRLTERPSMLVSMAEQPLVEWSKAGELNRSPAAPCPVLIADSIQASSGSMNGNGASSEVNKSTATAQVNNVPVDYKEMAKKVLPTIKLGSYDGSTPLETHLAKLDNCAEYYSWSNKDRLCHLKASLVGNAGQILWQVDPSATEADVTKLLRNRFGNVNQTERFRAELRSRKRQRGESLQDLYQDLRRLLALSFPAQTGELFEVIGRDAFLSALDDSALRVRVLDQQPTTMDDALAIACRMEAYGVSTASSVNDSVTVTETANRRVRTVKASDDTVLDSSVSERRLKQLEGDLADQRREIRQLRSDVQTWRGRAEAATSSSSSTGPPWTPCPPPPWPNGCQAGAWTNPGPPPPLMGPSPTEAPPLLPPSAPPVTVPYPAPRPAHRYGGRRHPTIDPDVCRLCFQRGHWKRECPQRSVNSVSSNLPDDNVNANVNGVCDPFYSSETYLQIDVHGVKITALVDSGCDQSVVPKRLIPENYTLGSTKTELFAANGTKIAVLGKVRLNFAVANLQLKADFLVSDQIDEVIFGYNWLRENKCHWLFDQSILVIHGIHVRLCKRPARLSVRRIYVREEMSVPANTAVNVPVRLPLSNLHVPICDWVCDAKEIRPGVVMARTLLPDCDNMAAIQFLNLSDKDQVFKSDLLLGCAEPAICIDDKMTECDVGTQAVKAMIGSNVNMVKGLWPVEVGQPGSVCDIGSQKPLSAGDLADDVIYPQRPEVMDPGVAVSPGSEQTGSADSHTLSVGQAVVPPTDSNVSDPGYRNDDEFQSSALSIDVIGIDNESCPSMSISGKCYRVDSGGDFSHVQPLIDGLSKCQLSENERAQVENLIKHNADLFSRSQLDVQQTDVLSCRINTANHAPVYQTLRRHPKAYLNLIDDTIDNFIEAGFVEPASSAWNANIVLVSKPGNPVPRITIDYRNLNSVTVKDRFPLPRISDCLDALSGSVYFSTLDLTSSFYSVPIPEMDRDCTAFSTRKGQFRWRVMPMGFCNSPSVFSRLMSLVLKGLTCVLAFIDDVIVIGKSFAGHLANLEAVFQRFRQAKLKFKPSKCNLFRSSVKFLGHIVSENGVSVDPDKVACIKAWPFPKSVSELRGFLGLSSYYRSFCKGFSTMAEPLTQMLRKGVPVEPNECRLKAFNDLKTFLTTAPVLAMPTDEGQFVLDVDASGVGCGACLQQWQDGKLCVLEYASRTFNKAERAYCVTRKELAALIFGLRHFRTYLLGRFFQVRCDHMALIYLRRTVEPIGQQARYMDYIEQFQFDLLYRKGPKQVNCDSLSRLRPCEVNSGEPCKQCNKRVTGKHVYNVRNIQTRAQKRREQMSSVSADSTIVHSQNLAAQPNSKLSVPAARADGAELSVRPGRQAGATTAEGVSRSEAVSQQVSRPARADSEPRGSVTDTMTSPSADQASSGVTINTRSRNNVSPRQDRRNVTKPRTLLQNTAPIAFKSVSSENWSPEYLAKLQQEDRDIAPVLQWISHSQRPPWCEVQSSSPALRSLWQQYESLVLIDHVLHRIFHYPDGTAKYCQLILPAVLKTTFLELIHADAAGHLKLFKCIDHVQRRVWWYNWRSDLKLFIQCCHKCSAFHRGKTPRQSSLHPMTIPEPNYRWSIDLCGPFCTSNGYKYIFTAIDPFSKFVIAVPIRNKEAHTIAKVIMDHIFLKWGLCFEILTDRGSEFENELSKELYKLLGVNKIRTTAYRPQTNGAIECFHRVMNSLLSKVVKEAQTDWSSWLNYVVFCYNTSIHSSTNYSPYFILTGRNPRWNIDLLLCDKPYLEQSVSEYAASLVERLHRVHEMVREHLHVTAETARTWYEKKVRHQQFKIGDKVRIFNPRHFKGRTPKWQLFYKDVAVVRRKLNDATYVVRSDNWRTDKIVHVDKLKLVSDHNL